MKGLDYKFIDKEHSTICMGVSTSFPPISGQGYLDAS